MKIIKTSKYNEIVEADLGLKRKWNGLLINVENPAGTIRYGQSKEGKEWSVNMKYDYGFLSGVNGKDGEGIDVYLGPNEFSKSVFVVKQVKPKTGEYDEDKCMLGFDTEKDAKAAYLEHYNDPKFFGGIEEISFKEFEDFLEDPSSTLIHWKKHKK